ncbi:MAG: putative rane protein [Gemmatimonadetes bacterium]|nr:putative rane protein [Gemmatimonadota bacterium]
MIDTISSTVLAWLLTYAIHSTALLALAWLLVRARKFSPAASDLIWKTAMLGGILTATAQLRFDVQPKGTVSLRPSESEVSYTAPAARSENRDPVGIAKDEATPTAPTPIPAASNTVAEGTPVTPTTMAVIAWAFIALVLGLSYAARRLILVGRIGDRRAVQDGRVLDALGNLSRDAGLRSVPRLTSTIRISSPIALGIREICVPETALTDLDLEQQRSMLAHELAHLARRDPIWLAVATLIERILWIQPLNRVARRQIATSAEYLCDEWAVRRTGSGVALARCLAQVAEWIQASPLGVPVAGMAEERSLLVSRVAKLLEEGMPAVRSRRALAFGAVVVILATIAIAPSVTGKSARASSVRAKATPTNTDTLHQVVAEAQSTDASEDASMVYRPAGKHAKQLTSADSVVVIALIARLKDENAEVRAAAAHSLGKLEDPRAVPGLIGALRDADPRVRSAAADALGEFHDPRAITALSAALSDSNTEVKQNVLQALSNYEEGVPSAAIVQLLNDSDAEIRHKAAHIVGQLKDRSASPALAKLVRDPNADVRQAAIEALAELHDQSAAAAILPALTDTNADVRSQALNAMEELKAPIAEPTLLTLMRDPSADVRGKAAELAGERSVIGAIPMLRRMLEDSNGDVREHAVSALSNIADSAANDALRAALTSKDPKVRRAAAEALGDRRQ